MIGRFLKAVGISAGINSSWGSFDIFTARSGGQSLSRLDQSIPLTCCIFTRNCDGFQGQRCLPKLSLEVPALNWPGRKTRP